MTADASPPVRYSATVIEAAPDQLLPGRRRWRMLAALAEAGGVQATRDNVRLTGDPAKSGRRNTVRHWQELTVLLDLGWVACRGGRLRLLRGGRAALERCAAEASAARRQEAA